MDKNYIKLISGLLMLPAVFLHHNVIILFIQAIYCVFLAVKSGRKFKLIPNLLLLFSIPLIHLTQPNGLIIITVFSFPITLGALIVGLRKALILITLLYLSFYMVSDRPQFPGKFGSLVSLQLFYVGQITLTWSTIKQKRPLIKAMDQLLLNLEEKKGTNQAAKKEKATLKDYFVVAIQLTLFYGLFLLGTTLKSGLLTT